MKKTFFILLTLGLVYLASAQTKTEINITDLPKAIPQYISKSMVGFTIDKAFKVVDKGIQSYAVVVKKKEIKHFLAFDKEGNFVKKIDKEVFEAKQGKPPAKPLVPVETQSVPNTQPKKK